MHSWAVVFVPLFSVFLLAVLFFYRNDVDEIDIHQKEKQWDMDCTSQLLHRLAFREDHKDSLRNLPPKMYGNLLLAHSWCSENLGWKLYDDKTFGRIYRFEPNNEAIEYNQGTFYCMYFLYFDNNFTKCDVVMSSLQSFMSKCQTQE